MQNDTLAAVDIAKEIFEVAVSDRPGRVALRKRLRRDAFLEFFAQLPRAIVVMEACGSAHHWARRIEELGHVVVLLPPQYVRPYVMRNKTDRTDVDALLEAFRNEQIRPVPIKTVPQQVIATLHRLRSGWLADRVRSINALRGLLRELGFFIPEGRKHVLPEAWEIIQDHRRGLPDALKPSLAALCEEIAALSTRIEDVEAQLEALAQQIPLIGTGHRPALRDRPVRLHRRPFALPLRPAHGQLRRVDAPRALKWPAPIPRQNLQARRRLPAHAPHPRGAIGPLSCQAHEAPRPPALLGPQPRTQGRTQQGRRRPRQQARPYHLGRLEERPQLRVRS